MKRILQSFFALSLMLLASSGAFAQLPVGATAPDFTATDLDGNEVNLYNILDQGKMVVLDFSATWCGPCWSAHTDHVLEDFYEIYGPDGTDEVEIIFVESDSSTTLDDLNGTGTNTAGDWVTGTPYSIIDDAATATAFGVGAYPTFYAVCPSRIISMMSEGYGGAAALTTEMTDALESAACAPATDDSDGALTSYDGNFGGCGNADLAVTIQNFGIENLMAATITATGCEDCPIEFDWTGDLATYSMEEVVIGSTAVTGNSTVDIAIVVDGDENAGNNSVSANLAPGTAGHTTHFRIDFTTDNWPHELSWELTEGGNVVASGSGYAPDTGGNGQDPVSAVEHYYVPTGCYNFNIYDAYGDGMNGGTQWGGTAGDGTFMVTTVNEDDSEIEFYSYDGSYSYDAENAEGMVSTVVSVDDLSDNVASMNVYPNPFSSVTNMEFTLTNSAKVTMNVVNMLGEVVIANDFGTMANGAHRTELDFSSVEAGLYFINLNVDGVSTTSRVTLSK